MVTDTYRILGLAGRGALTSLDGAEQGHEAFLLDLDLETTGEPDLQAAAEAAAEALAWPAQTLGERAERVASAVLAVERVARVGVSLQQPEAGLGLPVTALEVRLERPERPQAEAAPVAASAEAANAADAGHADQLADAGQPTPAPELLVPVLEPVAAPLPADVELDPIEIAEVEAGDPAPNAPLAPEPEPEPAPEVVRRPAADAPLPALLVLSSTAPSGRTELAGTVAALRSVAGIEVTDVSPLARTVTARGDLFSAVVAIDSTLGPAELAAAAGAAAAHREAEVEVLAIEGLVGEFDGVELPLPGAGSSAAVLAPWAQLDPGAVLPGLGGGPVVVLGETAPDRDGVKWLALDWLE